MRFPTLALLLAVCALGCGASSDGPSGEAQAAADKTAAEQAKERTPARPHGRPLPAFSGWTLDGQPFSISEHVGKRLLLYFFNPEAREAGAATPAVDAISKLRGEHNFEIIGVAVGSDRATAARYVAEQGLDFPVVDDSTAAVSRTLGLREPVTLIGVDAEGFVSFGLAGFGPTDSAKIEDALRTALRLPKASDVGPARPQAPTFAGDTLDSKGRFDLAAERGRGVVLIFFLHTCPHCHHALRYLREALEALPEDKRPKLVGVEITGRTYAVRTAMREAGLDFFPILFDDDGSIQASYGVFGAVPAIFFIDAEGRIDGRLQGWNEQTHEPLARMRIAKIAGVPVPMILNTTGYSGNAVCGVCHEMEQETWTFTAHAGAYDTLVKHGSDAKEECVSCHVVGYGKPGGFTDTNETPGLEDVGCESCHGRGGPHLSPNFVKEGDYGAVCVTCHDTKHSLGFDYATFRPRISHTENAALLALPPEEKRRLLAERGRPGGELLPTRAATVGSEVCRDCHAAEYETWAASPHAHSLETLEKQGKASDADCLRCHTTAFGREGGFPKDGTSRSHADLGRVGCESCHGPGGDHVAEDARKLGSIVSLGDKCDSCVVLQICGSCHDDANDPGFEFAVQEKIDRQRHGTSEAGTGKPKAASARNGAGGATLTSRAHALAAGG